MSASDAAPLPRLGEVFFDVRGDSRSMRLSWYADTGIAVFSIWQGGMCTGTFRLPMEDLDRMIEILERGPQARPGDRRTRPADGGRPGSRRATETADLEATQFSLEAMPDELPYPPPSVLPAARSRGYEEPGYGQARYDRPDYDQPGRDRAGRPAASGEPGRPEDLITGGRRDAGPGSGSYGGRLAPGNEPGYEPGRYEEQGPPAGQGPGAGSGSHGGPGRAAASREPGYQTGSYDEVPAGRHSQRAGHERPEYDGGGNPAGPRRGDDHGYQPDVTGQYGFGDAGGGQDRFVPPYVPSSELPYRNDNPAGAPERAGYPGPDAYPADRRTPLPDELEFPDQPQRPSSYFDRPDYLLTADPAGSGRHSGGRHAGQPGQPDWSDEDAADGGYQAEDPDYLGRQQH